MKLTFKDLKQVKFSLEAEPSETIAQVKEKIFKHKGEQPEWSPSLQKLIYSGKILADDKTVEFCKIEEKGFIVCMLAKPPKAAASSSSSTPAAAPSTPAKASTPVATPAAPAPAPAAPAASAAVPATPTPAGNASFNNPSALTMGTQQEPVIQNMVEMGFPREEAERALRAAFYNPDRAVEYLMNGFPEPARNQQATAPAQDQAASAQAPAAPALGENADPDNINLFEAAAAAAANRPAGGARSGAGAGAGGEAGLDFLRSNPQFQQLRRLVQESPGMLEPILQQVGQGNPQLAALISQNPDAFLRLLSEGVEGDEGEEGLPGMQTIAVTPEEAEAIDRLCGLGFSRDMVIQAYIACDKDEELTANYLFDNPDMDDM